MNWSEHFYYDEKSPTGLRWAREVSSGRHRKRLEKTVGEVAGRGLHSSTFGGYCVVTVNNCTYLVHRVVWEMHHGTIEDGLEVDHKDGDKSNNAIGNLRLVTGAVNKRNRKLAANNSSGLTGVRYYEKTKRGKVYRYWRAFWNDFETGKYTARDFSVERLGPEQAFQEAVSCREAEIARMNAMGAGYSARHGTTRKEVDER